MIQFLVAHWIYISTTRSFVSRFPYVLRVVCDKRMKEVSNKYTVTSGWGRNFFFSYAYKYTLFHSVLSASSCFTTESQSSKRTTKKRNILQMFSRSRFFSNYMSRRRTIRLGTDDSDKYIAVELDEKKFSVVGRKVFRKKTKIFATQTLLTMTERLRNSDLTNI